MNYDALTARPWNAVKLPELLLAPRGMLGKEERAMLYYIARECFRFEGCIVDAGAYIGASAFCLAAGMSDNSRAFAHKAEKPRIYSYDLFQTDEAYVLADLKKYFPLFEGNNYLSLHKFQTAAHAGAVTAIPGDFAQAAPPREPIEILFVDVAKTLSLNTRVVESYFPLLIEAKSLVIQQDYYHVWHPYIHLTMEYLADHFTVLDPLIDYQSRLYSFDKRIPADKIEKLARFDFTHEEQMALFDATIAKDKNEKTFMMTSLARVFQCIKNKRNAEAAAYFDKLTTNPKFDWKLLYGTEAIKIRDAYLAKA